MTPSERKCQLEELYRWSCADDALVLIWTLRVCMDFEPWQWAQEVQDRGGPPRSKTTSILRRLGVKGV